MKKLQGRSMMAMISSRLYIYLTDKIINRWSRRVSSENSVQFIFLALRKSKCVFGKVRLLTNMKETDAFEARTIFDAITSKQIVAVVFTLENETKRRLPKVPSSRCKKLI